MTTFVALGDSITLGIGDPAPGRAWRGWAALLAEGLPEPRLHNLINDTLRAGFDPYRFARGCEHTIGALRAAGAEVLTMRLPDPGLMLGLPTALSRPLARRIHAVNAVVDELAERFGALVFDAAGDPETYDPRMWSVDRLHPSERGHRLIAGRFHDRLAATGLPLGARPEPEPSSPPPTRLAQAGWMATKGTGWVIRRSTDLVPYRVFMGIRELWAASAAEPPPRRADDGSAGRTTVPG